MFRSDQGTAMDSFIEVPTGYSAFDILDGVAHDSPVVAPTLLEQSRSAVSAWQEALAVQLTTVIADWVDRTSKSARRH